jgi:hypothetical protein
MTLTEAILTTKQYQKWLTSLSMLGPLKKTIADSVLATDGWSAEKLGDAFATISDVLIHAEAVQADEAKRAELAELRTIVATLGADVRQLRDTKAKVEEDVMALHELGRQEQAAIEDRRGELIRLQTAFDDLRQKIQAFGEPLRAVEAAL